MYPRGSPWRLYLELGGVPYEGDHRELTKDVLCSLQLGNRGKVGPHRPGRGRQDCRGGLWADHGATAF